MCGYIDDVETAKAKATYTPAWFYRKHRQTVPWRCFGWYFIPYFSLAWLGGILMAFSLHLPNLPKSGSPKFDIRQSQRKNQQIAADFLSVLEVDYWHRQIQNPPQRICGALRSFFLCQVEATDKIQAGQASAAMPVSPRTGSITENPSIPAGAAIPVGMTPLPVSTLAGRYTEAVDAAAAKQRLPVRLVASVLFVETGAADLTRISKRGAIGPMQLMPKTAWKYLRVNPWNANQNVEGGAAYIKLLIERYGSVRDALIAYNEGPSLFDRGRVEPAALFYADRIISLAGA